MNREQLEAEISRLATEESKIIELQKNLNRDSTSWTALEIKRVEYSSHLAIRSIQLADMMSNTQRHTKLYGVEYSSHTDPQQLIRAGLRKAGIHSETSEPSQLSMVASGCAKMFAIGFAIAIVLSIIAVIADLDDNDNVSDVSQVKSSQSKEPRTRVQFPPLPTPSEPPPHRYEELIWPELSINAQQLIQHSIEVGEIQSRYTFFKHLRAVRHEFPNFDDISHVKIAILRALADNDSNNE